MTKEEWIRKAQDVVAGCCGCSLDESELRDLYEEAYDQGWLDGNNQGIEDSN